MRNSNVYVKVDLTNRNRWEVVTKTRSEMTITDGCCCQKSFEIVWKRISITKNKPKIQGAV